VSHLLRNKASGKSNTADNKTILHCKYSIVYADHQSTHTHTHTTLHGPLSGNTRVSWYHKRHSQGQIQRGARGAMAPIEAHVPNFKCRYKHTDQLMDIWTWGGKPTHDNSNGVKTWCDHTDTLVTGFYMQLGVVLPPCESQLGIHHTLQTHLNGTSHISCQKLQLEY